MTYKQAIRQGYKESERRFHLCCQGMYVSRKMRLEDAEVHVAGGKRKGQLYVWHNDGVTDMYMTRIYLTK